MSILKDGNLQNHNFEGCRRVLVKQPKVIIAELSGFDKDNIPLERIKVLRPYL